MANKKETYEKEIIKVIAANNIFVIKDIFAFYTGIKSSQFYNLELEKSESIKKALDDNKIKTKQSLKNKWYKSDNPTLQIALFKTIADDEELQALSTNWQKNEHSGEIKGTEPKINILVDGKTFNLKENNKKK
jgi:hypothetical protein